MALKVFILGATGYVGGEVFYNVSTDHPDWSITALVRDSDKGAKLAAAFPKTRLVYGGLDDADLLKEESKNADIVINCASSDHEASISAIVSGLASNKGYLIHTSGTGILLYEDIVAKIVPGTRSTEKVYNDYDKIYEVISMPDDAIHRPVDKLVINAHGLGVKIAILCPPLIYGEHRGPTGVSSQQVPSLAHKSLEQGQSVIVNEGLGYWNHVHVQDLGVVYSLLVNAAATSDEKVQWGPENYYFVESGEHVWKDVAALIGKEGKKMGLFETDEVVSITPEEMNKEDPLAAAKVGYNSRGEAIRARKILGWEPKAPALKDTINESIKREALKMGLKVGHAAKVAG